MKIIIGNDHGGYGLKLDILKYLQEREIEYQDVGSHSNDIVRYPIMPWRWRRLFETMRMQEAY